MTVINEEYITPKIAAALKGMTVEAFLVWVRTKKQIPYEKINGRIYMKRHDVENWIPKRKPYEYKNG